MQLCLPLPIRTTAYYYYYVSDISSQVQRFDIARQIVNHLR